MDIKINNLKKMYGNKVVFENLNKEFACISVFSHNL